MQTQMYIFMSQTNSNMALQIIPAQISGNKEILTWLVIWQMPENSMPKFIM